MAALQRHLHAAPRQLCRGDVFCVALRPCTSEEGILRSLHGVSASGKLGLLPDLTLSSLPPLILAPLMSVTQRALHELGRLARHPPSSVSPRYVGTGSLRPHDLAYFRVATLHPALARRALTVEIGHTDVTLSVRQRYVRRLTPQPADQAHWKSRMWVGMMHRFYAAHGCQG